MARHETWIVYVESKLRPGTLIYHSETNMGEAEANATAADLIAKGSRCFVTNRHRAPGSDVHGFKVA